MNSAHIDAIGGKARLHVIGEQIVADAANHFDLQRRASETAGGAGLVGALSTGIHFKRRPEDGFACGGKLSHVHDEVHVQTSDDDDYRSQRDQLPSSMPSFFNSSA